MGVLYTQALADRATAWLARPLTASPEGKRSAEGLLELATIWAAINRTGLPECLRQCQYSERAQALRNYLVEFSRHPLFPDAMSETSQSKYQIAPAFAGQTFVDEGLSTPITAENLTDEAAEYFIKKGRKDAFILRSSTPAEDAAGDAVADDAAADDSKDSRDYAGELEAEQKAHTTTTGKLEKEQQAHTKANEALKSEKEAHKATKKDLAEVQKQLTEAQNQLAALAEKAQDAAGDSSAEAGE
jgi:hypothetical protein